MTDIRYTYDCDGVFEVDVIKIENGLAYCKDTEGREIGIFHEDLFFDKQAALNAHESEWPEIVEDNQDDQYDYDEPEFPDEY